MKNALKSRDTRHVRVHPQEERTSNWRHAVRRRRCRLGVYLQLILGGREENSVRNDGASASHVLVLSASLVVESSAKAPTLCSSVCRKVACESQSGVSECLGTFGANENRFSDATMTTTTTTCRAESRRMTMQRVYCIMHFYVYNAETSDLFLSVSNDLADNLANIQSVENEFKIIEFLEY